MSRQSGMTSFKALLAVALFVVLVYLGIKLVPPFVNNYQFQEDIKTVARLATHAQSFAAHAQSRREENIREEVLRKAKDLGLPIKPDQVRVVKSNYGVNIDVRYNVMVETPAYTFNLKFNPRVGWK